MDPFLIFLVCICVILLASVIVNFYFIYLHVDFNAANSNTTTQTVPVYMADTEVQMTNTFNTVQQDQTTQTILGVKTIKTGMDYIAHRDAAIQAAELNYVGLSDQLEELSSHSQVTQQDLIPCISWITECEKAVVGNTQAAINLTQCLTEFQEQSKRDLRQELEKHNSDLTRDEQFQFTLLAKTLDHERTQPAVPHFHLPHQHYRLADPTHPPWETLPYMRRTHSREAYWNRCLQQDQFWHNIREQRRQDQPETDEVIPPLQDMDD